MTTIAHGIGWLWMGVLLLAAAAWGLYLTWKALRCALPRMWHWLREAWARGCPTAWDEYRDPLAPMETLRQQLDRMAAEAKAEGGVPCVLDETPPNWQRDAERKAVAARVTDAQRCAWLWEDERLRGEIEASLLRRAG